jgi:uncharacterized protein YjbI with pentapeptide repeats
MEPRLEAGRPISRKDAVEYLRSLTPPRVQEWNEWKRSLPKGELPSLSDASFRRPAWPGIDLSSMDLRNVVVGDGNLEGSIFANARLDGIRFHNVQLRSSNFSGARACDWSDTAGSWDVEHRRRLRARAGWELSHRSLRAVFLRCNLHSASFAGAALQGVGFKACVLDRCRFTEAKLSDAHFTGVEVDVSTDFTNAEVIGTTIERHTLESLGPGVGGLTVGQRMDMRVDDGLATLRSSFSGFWQWIHVTALLFFVGPYVWFIAARWSEASFLPIGDAPQITLLKALCQYIWSAGHSNGDEWRWHPAFLFFAFGLVYNSMRAVLLGKTKQLELVQEASGLPLRFSLTGSLWGVLERTVFWLFWVNLCIVLLHTLHFLMQEVPLPSPAPR